MSLAGVPPSLAVVAPPVEARIDGLLEAEAARWGLVDPELLPPLEALRRFILDGGKRLRPAFCHWAFVGAGGDPADPAVVDAGAALELLHAFALLHDDVMDGSHLRRGHACVHVDFTARHVAGGWRGEARRFGEGVAILVGDLAFVYADLLMISAPPAATEVFNELRIELNIGQALDLIGTAEARRDRPMARRIACYKSGAPVPSRGTSRPSTRSNGRCTWGRPSWGGWVTWPSRCRPTACRSARRSRCATTSSARSVTRP